MSSKYFEDLGDIYSDNISEKPEQSQLNENVAVDAKADNGAFSKDAGHEMIKDSGPEAAEGVEALSLIHISEPTSPLYLS